MSKAIIRNTVVNCKTAQEENRVIKLRSKHGARGYLREQTRYWCASYGEDFCLQVYETHLEYSRKSFYVGEGRKVITVAEYESILGERSNKKPTRKHLGYEINGVRITPTHIRGNSICEHKRVMKRLADQRDEINIQLAKYRRELKTYERENKKGWK